MELYYAIADVLGVPQEWIVIDKVVGDCCYFRIGSNNYNCRTVRGGKYLKKIPLEKKPSNL